MPPQSHCGNEEDLRALDCHHIFTIYVLRSMLCAS